MIWVFLEGSMVEILFAELTLAFLLSQHHTPIPIFRYGVSSTYFSVLFCFVLLMQVFT